MKKTLLTLVLPAALLGGAFGVSACGSSSGSGSLSLVAYSTPKEAYAELIGAFTRSAAGKGVTFTQSYGPSGDQSRAVLAGLPADVVAFSLAPDITKLVDKGLVDKGWDSGPTHGFVTDSVVVLTVRRGNPKHIRSWADLVRPGIQVITPNPFTSGGARWNVMAAYGAQVEQGRTPAQALDYLRQLFRHVPVQDKSARDSLQTFTGGKGDVLISYENEAITAQQKGQKVDYVIPPQTILIQNPIAVTAKSSNKSKARAFVSFLLTPAAQRIFAQKGYRTVLASQADRRRYPTPAGLFGIDRLGGWSKVTKQFFDPDKGEFAKIEKSLGVSTSK